LAAFLYAQLEHRHEIQAKRRHIWETYFKGLEGWALESGVQLPTVPSHCEQSYHMFYILLPTQEVRQALIDHLKDRGIHSVFHYLPLHLSDMGGKYGGKKGDCPVTERVSDSLLRLPFFNDLSEADQERVIAAIREFEPSVRDQIPSVGVRAGSKSL
jgi:dTDP-4-amino-4,6-dideoxygalactose transaminase